MLLSNREESNGTVILSEIDIEEVAEKIANDLKIFKLDSSYKMDRCKARIAQALWFYKKPMVDEICSTVSDVDMEDMRRRSIDGLRKSMTKLYQKARLDANVIHLYDRALTQETKLHINKKLIQDNLSVIKDKTLKDLQKIDDKSKTLISAAKSAIWDYIRNQPGDPSDSSNGKRYGFTGSQLQMMNVIDSTNRKARENFNVFLTNPTGKMTVEEIQSQKLLLDNVAQFEKKVIEDLQNQKEVMDQTINEINTKMLNLFPWRGADDDDDVDEEN